MRTPGRALPSIAVVLLALSACGEGDAVSQDDLSPAAVVRQATQTTQAQSVRYSMDVKSDSGPMSGSGEYQAGPPAAGRMTITMSEPEFGNGTYEMIAIGPDQWFRMRNDAAAAAVMPFLDTDQWIKIPAGEMEEDEALAPDDFDVRSQLQLLLAAADVKEVGAEEIDGVRTRHYSGTVTVAAVAAATEIPEDVRDELVDTLNDNKGDTAQVEAWIDDDFQIRRYVERGTDSDGAYDATVTLRDFGADIRVTAPAAAEVTQLPDFTDPQAIKKYEKQMRKEMEKLYGKDWQKELKKQFEDGAPFPEMFADPDSEPRRTS